MYKSKRARRDSKLYRKAGYIALACFTLISCTTSTKKPSTLSNDKILAHKLLSSGLCKEFKGRGRLKFGRKQERFTYNAILDRDNFKLAIDVPFKGQETLIMPLDTKKKVSGTLYKKVSQDLLALKKYHSLKVLDSFLVQNRVLFSDIKNIDSNYCDEKCLTGKVRSFSDGRVEYVKKMISNYELHAQFSQLEFNEYKVISLQGFYHSPNLKKMQRVLTLDLIVDSCESI